MQCLDVLIDVPVQGGMEKYGGKNMDTVQMLLDFMEKRIDKVLYFKLTHAQLFLLIAFVHASCVFIHSGFQL